MNRLPDVSIKLFGREYDLAFGRQPSGNNWLMAVNKETGNVLPLTATDGPSTTANAIYVLDMIGILPVLEAAGIVRRVGSSKVNCGFNLCRCVIVHAGLIERLAGLEEKHVEVSHEQGKSSHERD